VQTIGRKGGGVGARAGRHHGRWWWLRTGSDVRGRESRCSGDPAAQCSSGDGVEVLPVTWLRPYSRSDLGFVGGTSSSDQPREQSRRPPPLFIAQGDGGPPAMDGLGAPDQGASQGPKKPLGLLGQEINLTPTYIRTIGTACRGPYIAQSIRLCGRQV